MKQIRGRMVTLALGAAALLLLAAQACAGAEPTATPTPTPTKAPAVVATPTPTATPTPVGPKTGGVLKMSWRSGTEVIGLDPLKTSGGTDRGWLFAMCDTIYAFDKQLKYDPKNSLAESFDIGADLKTYTFHLREAKFPDGRVMTADDVVKNFQRYKDPANKFRYADTLAAIDTYAAVDARTLKIVTKQPEPAFITNLAERGACVHQPEKWAEKGDKYIGEPTMIGAFQGSGWVPDVGWKMAKSPNYFRTDMPYLDAIDMRIVQETRVRLAAVQSGELHGAYAEGEMIPMSLKDTNLNTVKFVGDCFGGYLFNVNKAPMDNIWLRKAIVAALDRDALTSFWEGRYDPPKGHGPIGPSIPWAYFDMSDVDIPYSEAKAKEYLQKSGLALPVKLDGGSPSTTLEVQHNELIQGYLKKVGIEWSFVTGKTADMNPRQYGFAPNPSEFHFAGMACIVLRIDPEAWLRVALYPNAFYNPSKKLPEGVEALFQKGATTFDVNERARIYKEAQRTLMEQAWARFPYGYRNDISTLRPEVGGSENFYGGDGQWRLKNLWLKK
ncbi:MAG: ABC transporter substrate-binding protein [Chloroflexi bacterium]|nr:ABC transporter substrate-binding protein [Chloroflexota bacterium]